VDAASWGRVLALQEAEAAGGAPPPPSAPGSPAGAAAPAGGASPPRPPPPAPLPPLPPAAVPPSAVAAPPAPAVMSKDGAEGGATADKAVGGDLEASLELEGGGGGSSKQGRGRGCCGRGCGGGGCRGCGGGCRGCAGCGAGCGPTASWLGTAALRTLPLTGTVLLLLLTRVPQFRVKGALQSPTPRFLWRLGTLGDFGVSASLVVQLLDILRAGVNWRYETLYGGSLFWGRGGVGCVLSGFGGSAELAVPLPPLASPPPCCPSRPRPPAPSSPTAPPVPALLPFGAMSVITLLLYRRELRTHWRTPFREAVSRVSGGQCLGGGLGVQPRCIQNGLCASATANLPLNPQ
jgi:hypothetical protein